MIDEISIRLNSRTSVIAVDLTNEQHFEHSFSSEDNFNLIYSKSRIHLMAYLKDFMGGEVETIISVIITIFSLTQETWSLSYLHLHIVPHYISFTTDIHIFEKSPELQLSQLLRVLHFCHFCTVSLPIYCPSFHFHSLKS